MSWNSRHLRNEVFLETLESMRDDAVLAEFVSANSGDMNRFDGPWKFERMLCTGIHDQFTVRDRADLDLLRQWLSDTKDLVVGHICYDTKNLLENLASQWPPKLEFPLVHFFVPKRVAILRGGKWALHEHPSAEEGLRVRNWPQPELGKLWSLLSQTEYVNRVERILHHIQLGDIYETNFCTEHFAEETTINPVTFFEQILTDSRAPFSCRIALDGKHLLCASPERFMAKVGARVFSQPMKGTSRKENENMMAMQELISDPKERAENIMITDLVRNDLSKNAQPGSVQVEELCGVYPFAHVNQMISTVSCALREEVHPLDALLDAFPMGSMTGAPKVRAMQLMDEYEGFGRGLFSGTVGYFTPEMDFDFNVVIRSVLYNEDSRYLSFPSGGAITINSDPGREYEECMLKAEAMFESIRKHAG